MISINDAEEILKHEYHLDNFTYLVKDILLPDFIGSKHEVLFNNTIFEKVTQLGESSACNVSIFEVYLKEDSKNKRVAITQEMFRILRGLRIDNALVSFVNPDKKNFRISLLTSKYEYNGDNIVRILSNPRRFSYSLGFGTKTKTAYKYLISKGKVNSLEELTERFSIEVVNKQFYNEIALCFSKLIGERRDGKRFERQLGLYGVIDPKKYAEFAVRLIGRITFCWFLKEKKSINGNSLIPEEFLKMETISKQTNYYHETLEPLFFELLNTSQTGRKNKYQEKPFNQIPYLNGGLFSPHRDDMYEYDRATGYGRYGLVTIPNEWFLEFYKVLSQYNFTVDENTSYDIELSIDPEMLGRIFENLLAEINPETGENAKKSTGSFYTPRDIVDYMVDSSLCEYLKNKTQIDELRLKALISYGKEDDEIAVFNDSEKKRIIDSLYSITVLDPACGSGAFPIGMLQKIVYILQEIDPTADLWFDKATENVSYLLKKEFEKKFNSGSLNYIRKLSVIQNSIFGVDIQPIAVEISRLRCFLSLVIEEIVDDNAENRGINPLPNLDFKFVIANSLKKLSNDVQMSLFEDQMQMDKLKKVREEYFAVNDIADKKDLMIKFQNIQNDMLMDTLNKGYFSSDKYKQLFSWKPFENEVTPWFDPDWMFGIQEGFDIVIGNPPYVGTGSRNTSERMDTKEKEYFRKYYPNSAEYKINLYALFMELGINLCKNKGVSTFIVPDSFLLGMYFSKIRQYILNNCEIKHITILDSNVFAACVGYSVVYLFEKNNSNNSLMTFINASKTNGMLDDSLKFSYPQEYAKGINRCRFRIFFDSKTKELIDKIEHNAKPLSAGFTGRTGVRSKIGQKEIIAKNQVEPTYKKGIISGSSILPYKVIYDGDWININPSLLNAGGWDKKIIENPKLLVRQTSETLIAAYDDTGLYHLNNVHSFAPDNSLWDIKYILALFNSKLLRWYYETLSNEKNRPMPQTDIETLESLPIKYNEDFAKQICLLVDEVLNKDDPSLAEKQLKQIDNLIYRIYEITPEEIQMIEES